MPAEIPDGAFIVARALFNSSLWTMRKDDKILAVTLIGLANWKDRKWFDGTKEITIKRGQLVRGVRKLAKEAGLSYQECRTSIKRLENVGFLTHESTGPYTIITLPKYHKYQDLTKYADAEWPADLTHESTQTQREPNASLTQTQREPNDKQVSYQGGDGKKGEEHTLHAKPTAHNHTVAAHLVSVWNRGPGFAIGHEAGQKLVKAYIASGVDAQKIEEVISDQSKCAGKKLFEILEPFRKKPSNGVPSIQEILDNFGKGDHS